MLVLTRKLGQQIVIGDKVIVKVLAIRGSSIRIGIEAPPEVPVHREEVLGQGATGATRLPTVAGPPPPWPALDSGELGC